MKQTVAYIKIKTSYLYAIGLMYVWMCSICYAQDIHFSNWNMSPLNVNPANTGMFDGDGRLIFNYRTQWKSVQVPYKTFSFGGDFNIQKSLIRKTEEAVGIIFNHDVSGDGRYRISDFKVPVNHKFTFKKDSELTVALGFVVGVTNLSIDPNRLSFDKQWDGDTYNQGLLNGENFLTQSKTFFDVGLGTVVQKKINQNLMATLGYGINHITKPNISFNSTGGVILRPKHNESLQFKYSFNNISALMIEYYGNQQQAFRENSAGITYYHTIQPKTNTVLNFGILTRIKDALITTVGLQHNSMRLQVSYDYTYSQFKKATNGRGGFEISFIYIYAKPKLFVPKTRVCPVYM